MNWRYSENQVDNQDAVCYSGCSTPTGEKAMSKGSKVIQLRIPSKMLDVMLLALNQANERRREAPYDMSSWIRACIVEKLAHLARSKKRKDTDRPGTERQADDIPSAELID